MYVNDIMSGRLTGLVSAVVYIARSYCVGPLALTLSVASTSVVVEPVAGGDDAEVRTLIERHLQPTGSRRAHHLLADWETTRGLLRRVVPTAAIKLVKLREAQDAEASAVPAD